MSSKSSVMSGKPKISGAVFRAPLGTPIPTDARTALDVAFIEQGYVSSEGWSRQINKAYNTINAWGGDEVARSRTEHGVGFSFSLIEDLNSEVQKSKFGAAAVVVAPATASKGRQVTVTYKGEDTDPSVWVFDMNDQGKLHRTVFFDAVDTTESFEQTFSDEDVISLPFEMTAYKGPTGAWFVDYTDDGKLSA